MKNRSVKGVAPHKGAEVKPGVPGMAVMKEANAPAHGFKRGGRTKSAGLAAGGATPPRGDKPSRNMRGRSPMSSASKISPAGFENG